jgi:prophage antirepressor-like protein
MSALPISLQFKDFKFIAYKEGDELWFIAKVICDYLLYSNSRVAIKSHCKLSGVKKIYTPTASGYQDLQYISQSNLIRLIMRSKKPEAADFQDWIVEKVIPSILKTGNYSVFQDNTLSKHLEAEEQKDNSKKINKVNLYNGGVEKVKEYNTISCLIHAGYTPKKVIEYGKSIGLKSKQTKSAKEVLRNIAPPVACSMSLADSLIASNPNKTLDDVKPITLKAMSVYDEMLKAGIMPIELK